MSPRQNAIAVLLSAIGLFWLSVAVLGTPLTRDSVDIAAIVLGCLVAMRLTAPAVTAFWQGGGRSGWQLLMGNVVLLLGWAAFCSLTYIYRSQECAETCKIALDPWVGFFKFWILGGIALTFFATNQEPTVVGPTKIYYVAVGVVAGVLLGVWVSGYLPR